MFKTSIGGRLVPDSVDIAQSPNSDLMAIRDCVASLSALVPTTALIDLATLETTVAAQGVVTALNSGNIALQAGTVASLNSPGTLPLGTAALYIKTNGNSTNSIFLNIAGTSVGWKAIATA